MSSPCNVPFVPLTAFSGHMVMRELERFIQSAGENVAPLTESLVC